MRGFISYSHTTAHNWRGPREDRHQHVGLKFVKSIRKHSDISLIGSWNRATSSYYPQVTLDGWHTDGIGGGNSLKAWYDAGHIAQAQNYYRLWEAPEQTFYAGLPSHFTLSDHLTFGVTPYAQAAYGSVASGATLPMSGVYNDVTPVNGNLRNLNGDAVVRTNGVQESYRAGFNAHFSLSVIRMIIPMIARCNPSRPSRRMATRRISGPDEKAALFLCLTGRPSMAAPSTQSGRLMRFTSVTDCHSSGIKWCWRPGSRM